MTDAPVWGVTEYVYAPDGARLGTVWQRRTLHDLPDGKAQVVQDCTIDDGLTGHALAAFAGTHTFELVAHGRYRHYLGPDVLGNGVTWGAGATLGQGWWAKLGLAFESTSLTVWQDRQLTVGSFSRAGAVLARIVAVAQRLTTDEQPYPVLDEGSWAAMPGTLWRGTRRRVTADGEAAGDTVLDRRYSASGWDDVTVDETATMTVTIDAAGGWRISGVGVGRMDDYGASRLWVMQREPGVQLLGVEVVDRDRGTLMGLVQQVVQQTVVAVDVLRLTKVSSEVTA